ncbi:uracil-DNA glycosylase-like protein [Halenospora varia]|nr:uracil-DNA glycosylase-like protein [Halenospora varia]
MEDFEFLENTKEEENDEATNSSSAPASFKGRLNLANYSFSPKLKIRDDSPSPEPRRSIRKSSSALSTPPISSPSPKRKVDGLAVNPSPKKKSRSPSGYAPPSTYAHLPELVDILEPDLICVFVGLNPGIQTARSGHAYAHPSNLFWKLLHSSGCTTRRCRPEEDGDLPRLFQLGNTNIVARPTRNGAELSKAEMDASVHILEDKIRRYSPEAVCIVGKSIWESIWRVRHGKAIKKEEFKYGWQDEEDNMGRIEEEENEWKGSTMFVAASTSGLAATLSVAEKERIWRELGVWIEQRRTERAAAEAKT